MQITTTFRDIPPNASLQASAERWVGRLEQIHELTGCHISIARPAHRSGAPFQIRIVMIVAGAHVIVTHDSTKDGYVAIADAFRDARRKLLDHVGPQRAFLKQPAADRYAGLDVQKW